MGASRFEGPLAPFSVTTWSSPIDELNDEFPIRLTTGRRLDSYNTGVQSNLYSSPLRRGETLDLCPEDAEKLGVEPGEVVQHQLSPWLDRGTGAISIPACAQGWRL